MSDKNNLKNIKFNYKIWLSTEEGDGIMGDGKWQILKTIKEYGSLMAATEALGITYRRTWGDLKEIEKQLGFPLLEKSRGGKERGGTKLSPEGEKMVKAFDDFHQKVDLFMDKAFQKFRDDFLSEE